MIVNPWQFDLQAPNNHFMSGGSHSRKEIKLIITMIIIGLMLPSLTSDKFKTSKNLPSPSTKLKLDNKTGSLPPILEFRSNFCPI